MAIVITITGTPDPNTVAVIGKPTGGSGVEFENISSANGAFDAVGSLARGVNLFPETNQIVAGLAAALGVPGFVVIDQLQLCLADLRRHPNMAERVYQQ